MLKIQSINPDGKAELDFRNNGQFLLKAPEGSEQGRFELEDGKIVLTSQNGETMTIENGRLKYVIGDKTYEFEFGQADLKKLAGVKK